MKALLALLIGAGRAIVTFLVPVLKSALADSLATLLPLALEIVRDLALDRSLTNAQKREVAVQRLRNEAIVAGVSAAESLLRSAVELAVLNLKAKEPM